MKFTLAILLLSIAANLQAESPKLTEAQKYQILSTFAKQSTEAAKVNGILAKLCQKDAECKKENESFLATQKDTQAVVDKVIKEAGLAAGSSFSMDLSKMEVEVVAPKVEAKSETKK